MKKIVFFTFHILILMSVFLCTVYYFRLFPTSRFLIEKKKSVTEANKESLLSIRCNYLEQNNTCANVHVAMPILGSIESWQSFLAIKSILMNEREMIHFHFLVDSTAHTIMQSMLASWLLPGVTWTFYDINEVINKDSWNHNQQCPVTDKVKKASALQHDLPQEVNTLVYIQPNVILTMSLYHLVREALQCEKAEMTPVASEKIDQTNLTEIQKPVQTEATGIILVNIAALKLFHVPVLRNPTKHSYCSSILFKMSSLLSYDYMSHEIVVSNSTSHYLSPNDVFNKVVDYDGYSFRLREREGCFQKDYKLARPSLKAIKHDKCVMLKWEGRLKRRVFPFLMEYNYIQTDPYDTTMVVHTALNRLDKLEMISTYWEGPMSVSIYANDSEVKAVIEYIQASKHLSQRDNISYHIMFHIQDSTYPVNSMRNLAEKYTRTPYAFFVDADFCPSLGLYKTLKKWIIYSVDMKKIALIVPAFETFMSDFIFPMKKTEAVEKMKNNEIEVFHKKTFKYGHAQTDYLKWSQNKTTFPYQIKWTQGYEPYVLLKRPIIPFDDRFVERYRDKISHITELHMAGFELWVIPDGFLIHLPHPVANHGKVKYKIKCYYARYDAWLSEKKKHYGIK